MRMSPDPSPMSNITIRMGYAVMSTHGVVIDGKVVHAGGVTARAKVEAWF